MKIIKFCLFSLVIFFVAFLFFSKPQNSFAVTVSSCSSCPLYTCCHTSTLCCSVKPTCPAGCTSNILTCTDGSGCGYYSACGYYSNSSWIACGTPTSTCLNTPGQYCSSACTIGDTTGSGTCSTGKCCKTVTSTPPPSCTACSPTSRYVCSNGGTDSATCRKQTRYDNGCNTCSAWAWSGGNTNLDYCSTSCCSGDRYQCTVSGGSATCEWWTLRNGSPQSTAVCWWGKHQTTSSSPPLSWSYCKGMTCNNGGTACTTDSDCSGTKVCGSGTTQEACRQYNTACNTSTHLCEKSTSHNSNAAACGSSCPYGPTLSTSSVTCVSVGRADINLSWTSVPYMTSGAYYQLQYRYNGSATWVTWGTNIPYNQTTLTLSNTSATSYNARVRAYTNGADTPTNWSNTVSGTINCTATPTPTPLSTININVYYDNNGNGVRDAATEPLASGQTVTVTGGGAQTYTTNGAVKTITNLVPGWTRISVALPNGTWRSTTTNPVIIWYPPTPQTVNIGIQPPAPTCAGGLTTSRASVDPGGTATLTCVSPTSPTGGTLVYSWPAPDYGSTANVNSPTTTWTAPGVVPTTVTAHPSVTICNAGGPGALCTSYGTAIIVTSLYSISGHIYLDNNGNGIKDGAESYYTIPPAPGGATVTVSGTARSDISDSTGAYTITGNPNGNYNVLLTIPSGYTLTAAASNTNPRPVTVSGAAVTGVSFGIRPIPCQVTTSPATLNLVTGQTGGVTASVTSGLGTASVTSMAFGSYNTSFATVSPASDATSPYSTTVTGVAAGNTAVWATATLNDGRTCQSTGGTDTNVNVTPPTQSISGTVYLDNNGNGTRDGSPLEPAYAAGSVTVTAGGRTNTAGSNYTITGNPNGNYNVLLTIPSGYTLTAAASNTNPRPVTVSGAPVTGVNFGIRQTFYVSGNVFSDTNKNELKDAGEPNYSPITITSTGGTVAYPDPNNPIAGSYQVSGLTAGSYTVSYTSLPSGSDYKMTFPANGPPPFFTITVGAGCDVGISNSASCNANNIINLNYGITNSNPWFQTGGGGDSGGDGGINAGGGGTTGGGGTGGTGPIGGFNDPVPSTALPICGGPYASIPGSTSTTPGLIFTGNGSAYFGQGSASLNQWVVGATNFGPVSQGGLIKTSYAYLLSIAKQAGITPVDLSSNVSFCSGGGLTNCALSPSLPNGIYIANGNLTLTGSSYTFPKRSANNTGNFIILVGKNPNGTNGNLNIQTKLLVPNGSTALFSASGDIIVDKSIGEASYTTACIPPTVSGGISTGCSIEGVFSADQSFIISGQNDCTIGPDIKLNVAGSIVTNASLSGGTFTNQRDLCANNIYCPVFTVNSRPDFILNAPSFIKKANYTWQEIAP